MTKEAAQPAGSAAKTMDCPKCQGAAKLITPLKAVDQRVAVYGCSACGYAFKADGGVFLEDTSKLRDYFRGATLGNETLLEAMKGEQMNPATRTLFTAMMMEYGLQMWFDGLRQGLLLGAIQQEKKEVQP